MKKQRTPSSRLVQALLLTLCCWLLLAGNEPAPHADEKSSNEDARQAEIRYQEAKEYYQRLESDNAFGKDRKNWLTGVRKFRRLYILDSKNEQAPCALYNMAKMHHRMYQRFQLPMDLEEAIAYYTDVTTVFPRNSLADDAFFANGEIFLYDKNNPAQAAKWFGKIVSRYADGDKYAQTISVLLDLSKKYNIQLPKNIDTSGALPHLSNVLPVKYWSSDDYTRIVIRATEPVKYTTSLLEKDHDQPRRLYIDFAQSYIPPRFIGPIPIEDGLLKQVRTGQFNQSTVRVVLDIKSISDYKIFSLNDPFRVIIDVTGEKKNGNAEKNSNSALAQIATANPTATFPEPQVSTEVPDNSEAPLPPVTTTAPVTTQPPAGETPAVVASTPDATASALQPAAQHAVPQLPSPTAIVTLEDHKKRQPSSGASPAPPEGEEKSSGRGNNGNNGNNGLTLAQMLGLGVKRIVLDPGHGGKDPGAMAFGLKEKAIVLEVAKVTAATLKTQGYEVILTRETDKFLELEERTAIANTVKADLFISIHVNAHHLKSVRGIETFYLNLATNTEAMRVAARENSTSTHNISDLQDILNDLMKNSKIQESSRLAEYVHSSMISGLDQGNYRTKSLGVKQAPFYVLIGANMPAVLAEISFITNPDESKLLRENNFLNKIGNHIAEGIAEYANNHSTAALKL